MPPCKPVSGAVFIKILCKYFGFEISGRKGSHVRLSRNMQDGKIGTVIPIHDELAPGTLRNALKLAGIPGKSLKSMGKIHSGPHDYTNDKGPDQTFDDILSHMVDLEKKTDLLKI